MLSVTESSSDFDQEREERMKASDGSSEAALERSLSEWIPKYRHRVLTGEVGQEVKNCIQVFSGQLGCEVVELNIQQDHIHLISNVPPKVSISKFMGTLKGRTAIRVFSKFPYLKQKPYWGNHFWAPGYCVDTVGLDAEMIRKYVKYQENTERREEQLQFKF
jgi:putative transposase